ncbi:MAG TPA: hypothetical protein DCE63_03090 [Eubacterium sp.]|nr:hypothetical protein [Eubacterium sp.]
MNELEELKSYSEYKAALDKQMLESAEGFVRIGYLLKLAKDTDILRDSQYSNVLEFAKAEYGIDKTMVSRFISINDRFSEGGNSPVLRTGYQGFGYAKLVIMLQLPDALNEELTPDYSKREIQALKEEVDEEKKVSDLEIYAEGTDSEKTELEQIIYKICEENIDVYERIYDAVTQGELTTKNIIDIFAPAGDMIYSVRVQGAGRKAVSFKQGDEDVSVVSLRTSEKDIYNVNAVFTAVFDVIGIIIVKCQDSAEGIWQQIYNAEYPKKAEIAPVQPMKTDAKKQEEKKTAPKKMKVVKAKQEEIHSIEKSVPKASPIEVVEEPEKLIKTEADGQLEGQKNIEDYKEIMPDNSGNVESVEGTVEDIPDVGEMSGNAGEIFDNSNETFAKENETFTKENETLTDMHNTTENVKSIRNNIITSALNIKFALDSADNITDNVIDRLIAITEVMKKNLELLKR